jgi:hypothetical protein
MIDIVNLICQVVVGVILVFGFYSFLAYILAFSILIFGTEGRLFKFLEWSVNNQWCFPLYYLCAVALGIIVFYLDIDITENVGKKYN